jgi:CRP-like cAMP-binding protein
MYSNATQNNTVIPFPSFGELDYRQADLSTVRTLSGPAHWAFFKYISAVTGIALSDEDKAVIADNVKIKKLRKRQYFLQEGDVCKHMGFIVKGAVRMFSVNERGQESIVAFALENSWVSDHDSFNNAAHSDYHIEAMEDTELLTISCAQLQRMVDQLPVLALMFRQYQAQQLIAAQKRINVSLSMTAEERYYDLLKCKPEYAQRFSQNMLACYLGLKPETLSRIRNR